MTYKTLTQELYNTEPETHNQTKPKEITIQIDTKKQNPNQENYGDKLIITKDITDETKIIK